MKKTRTLKYMGLSGLLLMLVARPSFAGPPYNVDDPGTPEARHYQITIAYLASQVAGSETQFFPNLNLGYGITNNLMCVLNTGGGSVRNSGSGRVFGLSDTNAEVKWRFLEETKQRPQIAVAYNLKIPTANVGRGLGSGSADHTAWLTGQKSFGRFSLFSNVGYNFLGGGVGQNNLFYGGAFTYQTTQRLQIGAQVYGNTANASGRRAELAWGLGMQYNYNPDRALMLQLGRSEHGFSDLNVYAGMVFTFK